jgi:hypothetical protein
MLQAYIFVMLSATYLAVATHHSQSEEHLIADDDSVPEEPKTGKAHA